MNTPIFTSSAVEYLQRNEVTYPRHFNTPNQRAVTDKLCELEGAEQERSLKTLALRVERQSQNAQQIAEFLEGHDGISRVHYPGLKSCTGHEIAKSQMSGFGGMLSLELAPSIDLDRFLSSLKLIRPAVSLGGVETLISSPVHTSHAKVPSADRHRIGITDRLLRLSVGIESVADLIDDFERSLSQAN